MHLHMLVWLSCLRLLESFPLLLLLLAVLDSLCHVALGHLLVSRQSNCPGRNPWRAHSLFQWVEPKSLKARDCLTFILFQSHYCYYIVSRSNFIITTSALVEQKPTTCQPDGPAKDWHYKLTRANGGSARGKQPMIGEISFYSVFPTSLVWIPIQ